MKPMKEIFCCSAQIATLIYIKIAFVRYKLERLLRYMNITIDKTKLESYIARMCPYSYRLDSGKILCEKPKEGTCNIAYIEKIELNCPYDCPHRDKYKWKQCTLGKCSIVKKVLKELE